MIPAGLFVEHITVARQEISERPPPALDVVWDEGTPEFFQLLLNPVNDSLRGLLLDSVVVLRHVPKAGLMVALEEHRHPKFLEELHPRANVGPNWDRFIRASLRPKPERCGIQGVPEMPNIVRLEVVSERQHRLPIYFAEVLPVGASDQHDFTARGDDVE